MTTVIALFVAGIILVIAEFFLPGGVLGILGFLMIAASTVFGVINFPQYALFIVTGEVMGLVISVVIGMYLLSNTSLGSSIILGDTMSSDAGYSSPKMDPALKGQIATAHTALRPAGTIMLGEQRINAVSDGTFIDEGSSVKIIQVEGHRVVVELREEESVEGAEA